MNRDSISVIHVILISMTAIGLKNHVTILPPLLKEVGRDGWMSVLLASLLMLPWGFLFLYIHNKSNQGQINKWLKQRIGKIFSIIFMSTLGIFLIVLAAFTMRETLQWINATFLSKTPIVILLIIYTILCVSLAASNLQTIAITNAIVLFGVVIFGFFVAFTNIQVKEYYLLRPFFEHGFQPILKGAVYPASGIVELVLLLFIQHKIKDRIRFIHYLVIIFILMGLTLGPLIGAITEFGPDEASKQLFPAYEEWRLVTIGRFIEHIDFLSIYQWLTGAFIRVGMILYIIVHMFNLEGKKKQIWGLVAPVFITICLLVLVMEDQIFVNLKGNYMLPITFIVLFSVSLFLAIVALLSGKASRRNQTS